MSESSATLVFATGVSLAAPMIYAAMGEVVSETAGVINIELEGMMLAGAFAGVIVGLYAHSLLLGFAAAAAMGLCVAALHGLLCFKFGVNQVVSGIVLNILVLGGTSYGVDAILGNSVKNSSPTLSPVSIPGLASIPFLGPVLFRHDVGVYVAGGLVVAVWYLLRGRLGLGLKAAGEKPAAAEALGLSVLRVRWIALLLCGLLAGAGGGQFALAALGVFTPDITAGAGFIALAAVIFGRWTAWGTLGAVVLFATVQAFEIHAQTLGIHVPYQLMVALPYLVTLLALGAFRWRHLGPSALGVNFQRA